MSSPLLTTRLLAAPARHTIRRVAYGFLSDIVAERDRLGNDATALHDFRVAMRRLRSWLRAYRPWLRDTVRARSFRALRAFADATNRGREAEVELAWLDEQRGLPEESRAFRSQLETAWRAEGAAAAARLRGRLASRFDAFARRLERRLSHYEVAVSSDEQARESSAAVVMAKTIHAHAVTFTRSIRKVRSANDPRAAHRARIAGKRLRYLLEPLSRDKRIESLVQRLAELQDVLGNFHDAHHLCDRIERARKAGTTADSPGLDELARRARERAASCFERFEREWLGGPAAALAANAVKAAARVAGTARKRSR